MIQRLLARFRPGRITLREKRFLIIAAAATLLMMVYGVYSAIGGYFEKMAKLDQDIVKEKAAFKHLVELQAEYERLNREVELLDQQIEKDQGKFLLLSYLESLAVRTSIRTKISYMRPKEGIETDFYKESSVEMKIEKVNLNQAIKFLTAINGAPHVMTIRNLHFKTRYADPELMDVSFWVSTFEHVG
ncbi:MAG TPA: type 4a pilus biogenesis protein PilO [Nitrospiria bacterium]